MTWRPSDMTSEYQQSLAIVRQCCHRRRREPTELTILRSMEADLEWTIAYMATGDDRVYGRVSRCVPCDPQQLSRWIEDRQMASPIRNTDAVRVDVLTVLDELSPRELETYVMHEGEGLSYGDIAELLGISRGTVQGYVKTARAKVQAAKEPPLTPCT